MCALRCSNLPSHECDDGNFESGDGCSDLCKIERGYECDAEICKAVIGDKIIVEGEEECDDGNKLDGDGCSSEGKIEEDWDCSNEDGEASVCI